MTIDESCKILNVNRGATQEEIKAAYLKLIKKWHPDINKSPEAIEKAKQINEAYQTLTKATQQYNPQTDLWEQFFGRRTSFGFGDINPFININFDFDSKISKSSVILEVDESNSKDLDLIPEILRRHGFVIKSFTITKYH